MNKSELFGRVRESHAQLMKALDGFSEEEAARKGLNPEWSVKDSLAHIIAWEQEGARIVREIQAGTWQPKKLNKEVIDGFNARVVKERAGRSLSELMEEFNTAHRDIESLIQSLPEEVDESTPAFKYIEGVTFKHLAHHAAQLAYWKEQLK